MRDVIFLPLDVPKVPRSRQMIDLFDGGDRYVWWQEEVLLGNKDYDKPLGYPETWNPGSEKFQPLIDHITEHLPFEYLSYVRLARAVGKVGLHVDDNYEVPPFPHHKAITAELKAHHLANEPIGYRVILSGSRDTFYFCKDYDPTYRTEPDQPRVYATIPEETDFFLIRNYQQPHGVDTNALDDERIVGFMLGRVNEERHRALVERSMTRFGEYVVRELP